MKGISVFSETGFEMKYTLSAFADEASPLLYEQIETMQKNGVDALEIRGVNGRNISDMTRDEVRCAYRMLSEAGISVWSIGSPIGKIGITDEFGPHLDKFKKIVDYARLCSAKCIRLFSFYGVDSPEKENEALERLSAMADAAKGSGVVLCHENEKGIFGWNAENCLRILEQIEGIRGVFDPANFVQCGVDTKAAWNRLAGHIEYLHIKDALANGKVVPAGHGIGNLEYIIGAYHALGGNVYSLEPHLAVFKGFSDLEKEGKTDIPEYEYPNSFAAFAASADAAKAILDRVYAK